MQEESHSSPNVASRMQLSARIQHDRKIAMKEKNALWKEVLSYIRAQIKNKEIDTKKDLIDDEVMQVIKKDIKSRNETLETLDEWSEEFVKQHNAIDLLQWYLPEPLSSEEIRAWIEAYLNNTVVEDINPHRGAIQWWLKAEYWWRVDGKTVNDVINSL